MGTQFAFAVTPPKLILEGDVGIASFPHLAKSASGPRSAYYKSDGASVVFIPDCRIFEEEKKVPGQY